MSEEKPSIKCPCLDTTFDACPMVLDLRRQLAALMECLRIQKNLADAEIERLKSATGRDDDGGLIRTEFV